METIENVVLCRRDGYQLPEKPLAQDLAKRGLKPDLIIRATWNQGAVPRFLAHEHGMVVNVITGRQFLAIMFRMGSGRDDRQLAIVNADGSIRSIVSNEQIISGKLVKGSFSWTGDAYPKQENAFSGVFDHPNGLTYRI